MQDIHSPLAIHQYVSYARSEHILHHNSGNVITNRTVAFYAFFAERA